MPNVKTAISVPKDLFDEIERYSKRHHLSRSEVFAQGAARLLQDKRSRRITEKFSEIYGSKTDDQDARAWQNVAVQSMAKLLKDDQW